MDALLAALVGILSPLVLKYVPLKGIGMVLVTWVLSFALAAGDIYVTKGASAFTAQNLAATFAIIYALQQVVFIAFQKNEPAAVSEGPPTGGK
jgi:hypothetical protein